MALALIMGLRSSWLDKTHDMTKSYHKGKPHIEKPTYLLKYLQQADPTIKVNPI